MFQPHRFSRTQKLKEEFGRAFGDAHAAVIADIYPASEVPIPGVTGQTIVDEMIREGHAAARYQPDRKQLAIDIGRMLEPGDCVISLGAGNIHEAGSALAKDVALLDELHNTMGTGLLKLYEPLAKHTTMRIGGPAQFWAEPETEEGFARLVKFTTERGIPLFVIDAARICSCAMAASAVWLRNSGAGNSSGSKCARDRSRQVSACAKRNSPTPRATRRSAASNGSKGFPGMSAARCA